jgi:hypothetical protein
MLSKELLDQIESGEITSRRQLYRIVGRSRKLLQWLNDNEILIPTTWTKEMFHREMKKRGIYRARDDWNMVRLAQRFYGSWNNALYAIFGEVNQSRYTYLSEEELKQTITDYIIKYKRLPLREEFNGSSKGRPYWEAILNRLNLSKWSDVFGVLDLSNVQYFHDKKHGLGRVYLYEGKVYLSRQEYLIGKYLTENQILFEKEVPYGNCGYIFDFYLVDYDVYIEYYGITTKEYKQRVEQKRQMYGDRKVIEIFKHDNTINKIALEVQRL